MKKFDLLITGVGGQGVILASDIIGEVALNAGYDVKKTDTLGMAQRGGSVVSNLRIGDKVWSPLAQAGNVDIILAFEKLEGARWAYFLNRNGVAIVNNNELPPLAVNLGAEQYPADGRIKEITGQYGRILIVEGTAKAKELGNLRTLNIFMLGCISGYLPFKVDEWLEVISQHLAPKIRDLNIQAFNLGRREIKNAAV